MTSQSPIDKFLGQLKQVQKTGNGYLARCPAHPDKNPSLSIGEGRDGRALLYCHAGCSLPAILKALDMKTSDLYPGDRSKIDAVYIYRDGEGNGLFEMVRLEPKAFYARHKDNDRYVNNIKDIKLVPYRLPQLIRGVEKERFIFIVEGEKDCENVVSQLKLVATTFAFGLRWQDHYAEYFEDAKVVIIPDNDKPGIEKAQTVAKKLTSIAESIRIITLPDLPDKGDISDWIEQGGTRIELLALIKATPFWEPEPEIECTDIELGVNAKIAEYSQRYATVMVKGKYVVIEPDSYDPSLKCSTIEFISTSALEKKYAHDKLVVGYKGNNPVEHNSASVWLEHPDRRDYDGIVFDPAINHGPRYFNLWQGFAVQPRPARIDYYLNHIYEVIANGDVQVYDHIIALMADAVQLRPIPGVATAILGEEGVGKGIVINNFGQSFGRHYLHITQGCHLTGKFNRHLAEGLVVFVDEAFWAGDKQAEGVLKGMITEDRIMIEPKGINAYPVKNHNRIFMASNNDWMVPASMEARRFFVVRASNKHIQDRTYFGRIQKQMDNGGREGLLHYLQQYDLDGIDLTEFPRTEELGNQKLLTMDPFDRFWFSLLQDGQLFSSNDFDEKLSRRPWKDGIIESELFYKAFTESLKNQPGKWFSGPEGFGLSIKKMVPNRQKKMIKGAMRYVFPSLQECRDLFEKRTNQNWEWQPVSEDDD